jgi:hydrogenase/urease accessory protein HupE
MASHNTAACAFELRCAHAPLASHHGGVPIPLESGGQQPKFGREHMHVAVGVGAVAACLVAEVRWVTPGE